MSLTKYKIDKAKATGQYYLVGGNRVHLAEVESDLVAEKLFKAGIPGVTQIEAAQPVAEIPAETAEPAVETPAEPVAKPKR
jgi:hypothetical protein